MSVAEVIDRIAGTRYDRLDIEERQDVDDVLEAALAWSDGGLPIHEFARVGTIPRPAGGLPSAGYTRSVAMLSTPISDPRRMALRRAIDTLLRFQGLEITRHGVFDKGEVVNVPIRSHPVAEQDREAAA